MMRTEPITHFSDSSDMSELSDTSVQLVVTSPPYPMIEMWDAGLGEADPRITKALDECDGPLAFELMHQILDKVWTECYRVLIQGGFACINVGDATRTIGGDFALYTNRSRIDNCMIELGFTALPSIVWRKQSNAPNKFMGSGMLPAGAYVTHEHEHILIYRKGGKRQFNSKEEKQVRRESAFFWEERNVWFSDLWDIKGTRQALGDSANRERSAAYPYELPFRIIAMYSVKGDTVLDPFMGSGSTHAAAMALGRNSIGYEIDPTLKGTIEETLSKAGEWGQKRQQHRLDAHANFVEQREENGAEVKHHNENHQMKVMTSQEKNIELHGDLTLPSAHDPEDRRDIAEYLGVSEEEYKQSIGDAVDAFEKFQMCFEIIPHRKKRKFRKEFIFNRVNADGTSVGSAKFVGSPPETLRKYKDEIQEFVDFEKIHYRYAKNGKGDPVTEEVLMEQARELQRKVAKKFLLMGEKVPEIRFECYFEWVKDLVFNRTWDGVRVGEENAKEWLKTELAEHVPQFTDPPKGYDSKYEVDLIIAVNGKWIGISVKPTSYNPTKAEKLATEDKHKKFQEKYGGKVFFVWNDKDTLTPFTPQRKLPISLNKDIIEGIDSEIERLKSLSEEE